MLSGSNEAHIQLAGIKSPKNHLQLASCALLTSVLEPTIQRADGFTKTFPNIKGNYSPSSSIGTCYSPPVFLN